jgi:hypothetical protein
MGSHIPLTQSAYQTVPMLSGALLPRQRFIQITGSELLKFSHAAVKFHQEGGCFGWTKSVAATIAAKLNSLKEDRLETFVKDRPKA